MANRREISMTARVSLEEQDAGRRVRIWYSHRQLPAALLGILTMLMLWSASFGWWLKGVLS